MSVSSSLARAAELAAGDVAPLTADEAGVSATNAAPLSDMP